MPAAPLTLTFHSGQRVRRRFRVRTPDGTFWNFTGFTLRSQVRDKKTGLVPLIDRSTGDGITVTGTAHEWVEFVVPFELSGLAPSSPCVEYVWDLWARSADGSFDEPILAGPVVVLRSVSQRP